MSAATLRVDRAAVRPRRLALDPVLAAASLALLSLGLVMVSSASLGLAERDLHTPFYYLSRQATFAAAGLLAALVALGVPLVAWERLHALLLLAAFFLLVLVLVPGMGHSVNGSTRWLPLGPVNLQVSEPARLAILVYLCAYLARRAPGVREHFSSFFKPMLLIGVACALLLAQPDFGAAAVLLCTALALFFVAGARMRDFLLLLGGASLAMAALVVTSPYRLGRLTAFLDPWADPYASGFQLTQSLIAIGRGEWIGVGLGDGVQKLFYLPEAHTDFLFAVLAEELGLAGVAVTLGLYAVLVWRAFAISGVAARGGLAFHAYVALAVGFWLGLQAFVNIGVNMGVLPTKGLTLPLMSYGGSSLLVTCAAVGLLLRVHHELDAMGCSAKRCSAKRRPARGEGKPRGRGKKKGAKR